MSLLDCIIGIFAPHLCIVCGIEGPLLCIVCRNNLPAPLIKSGELMNIQVAFSATSYNEVARDLVWRLKYGGAQSAATTIAEILMNRFPTDLKNFLIVPIPTASSRVRQRGYDQAVLIARELSRLTGAPISRCLVRQGQAHQVGADRQQRKQQLQHAFRVRAKARITGKNILLVDDVMTTGATIEAAAAVLHTHGADHVYAATFAAA